MRDICLDFGGCQRILRHLNENAQEGRSFYFRHSCGKQPLDHEHVEPSRMLVRRLHQEWLVAKACFQRVENGPEGPEAVLFREALEDAEHGSLLRWRQILRVATRQAALKQLELALIPWIPEGTERAGEFRGHACREA